MLGKYVSQVHYMSQAIRGPNYADHHQYYQSRQYAGAWWSPKVGNVDLHTGDYTTFVVDAATVGGRGLSVQIGRTYHSTNRS